MKHYNELTENAREVASLIDVEFCDCKEICKLGNASSGMLKGVIDGVLYAIDNCRPKLTPSERKEVLDYVKSEYGISM